VPKTPCQPPVVVTLSASAPNFRGTSAPEVRGTSAPEVRGTSAPEVRGTSEGSQLHKTEIPRLRCATLRMTKALFRHPQVCWLASCTHLSQLIGALPRLSESSGSRYTVSIGGIAMLGNSSLT